MTPFESQSLTIHCAGEELLLHPARAVYWPRRHMLLVADVHVGKEHAFSRTGIAIPGGISEDTLARLFSLCDAAGAKTLMVLGDFLHAQPESDESWLPTLRDLLMARPGLSMQVVAGNHDAAQGRLLTDPRLVWHPRAIAEGPFVMQHEPADDPRGYVLSGHLHPAWRLAQGRRGGVRTPVFWFRQCHAVLPAFGQFTGGMGITPDAQSDRLYMACDERVLEVPANVRRRGARTRAVGITPG